MYSVQDGDTVIKETVCLYCSYRYRYRTEQAITYCPICGASSYTDDLTPIRSILEEDE